MKKLKNILLFTFVLLFNSCDKQNKYFELKAIKLTSCHIPRDPIRKLSFRIVDGIDNNSVLGVTDKFSTESALPITLGVSPKVRSKLYKQSYVIELIEDSGGIVGACTVDMDKYKIIFPIDMEIENEQMNISISGSWH